MSKIFDTHSHMYGERYSEDLNEYLKEHSDLVMCQIGYDKNTNDIVMEQARNHEQIICAIGVHPVDAPEIDIKYIEELESNIDRCNALKSGVDMHHSTNNLEAQIIWFRKIMDLARKYNKAVVIHSRNADDETYEVLKDYADVKTVMHCYAYGVEGLQKYLDINCYISFTGIVTFKNGQDLRDVVPLVPDNKLLAETDCPWLAPAPNRGKTNYPHYVKHVIEKIAEIKNISFDDCADLTFNNGMELYGK